MPVHSKRQVKIKDQVGALLFNETFTEVLAEYFDYSNLFSVEYVAELSDNTGMNEYAIKLENGKQLHSGPIYSLGSIELKTLKTYIKISLANGFIRPSKFPIGALILFNKKSDRSLCLCVDY